MARIHEGNTRIPLKKIHLPENMGLLNIYRNVETEIISFDVSFKNVIPRRFNKSTKLTDYKKAEKLAIQMCNEEYKVRDDTGLPSRSVGTKKILEGYLKDIKHKSDTNQPSETSWWTEKKYKTHKYIVLNHLMSSQYLPPLQKLTENKLELFRDELRDKGLSDKTIANIKVVLVDAWKFARRHGHINKTFPDFPTLVIKQKKKLENGLFVESSYAHASLNEFNEAYKKLEDHLNQSNKDPKSPHSHNQFVFLRWIRILMDTGMRPIIPLTDEKQTKDYVYFERFEKQIHYHSKGQAESKKAIKELNAYYKKMGIENGNSLIVDRHGNEYKEGTWSHVRDRCMELMGWLGRKDNYGRSYVPYSIRHGHITNAVKNKEPIHLIAKRCGTSVEMIMKIYYEHDYFDESEPVKTPFN